MGLEIVSDQENDLDNQLYIWLVFHPVNYSDVDNFSTIPWFGVALFGMVLGNLHYLQGQRDFVLPDCGNEGIARLPRALGHHTLPIDLLHQPILSPVLYPHAVYYFAG